MPSLKECLTVWKIIDDFYEVEVVDGLKDDKGVPQKGCCSEEERLIQIDRPVAESDTLDSIKTILHEVCHPVVDSLYLGKNFDKSEKEMELLDNMIEFSTSCLLMLMMDNTDQFLEILNLIKRRKDRWRKRRKRKPR